MGADLRVRLQSNYPFLLLLYHIICQSLKKSIGFFLLIEQLCFLKAKTGKGQEMKEIQYEIPESVKLIVFICQSTIRLAKSKKCTLIMLNQSA